MDLGLNVLDSILDEGHKIKNSSTKLSKNLRLLNSEHRVILSGTPIQNNLSELWSLYDYIFEGQLLGSSRSFTLEFAKKIERGNHQDATNYEKKIAIQTSDKLKEIIGPYFLRREKGKVLNDIGSEKKKISQKNDLVVWVTLSKTQLKLYQDYIESPDVKAVLNQTSSALASLSILKKICDHPMLLKKDEFKDELSKVTNVTETIEESGKLKITRDLLKELKKDKHRVLIFSQSTKMLDLIELLLYEDDHSFVRIDGTMTDSRKRQDLIDGFNKNSNYFCFLLTTQTGGVGITLTGADRVIIFDPAWNPASDNQAVDRAYRIGQMNNVIVYRFISCGTIEEKIYRKQVYKDTISKTATQKSSNQYRYFTRDELATLMKLDDPYQSETQKHLASIHKNRNTYPELEEHLKVLKSFGIFGTSDHDLLFNEASNETFDHIDSNAIQKEVEQSAFRVFSDRVNPVQKPLPIPKTKVPIPQKVDVSRLTALEFKHLIMGVRLFGDQNWRKILESFPFNGRNTMFLKGEWEKIKKNVHYTQIDTVLRSYDQELFPNGNCPPVPKLQRDVICIDDEPNQIVKSVPVSQPTIVQTPETVKSSTKDEKETSIIEIDSISPISKKNDKSLNDSIFSEIRNTSAMIESFEEDEESEEFDVTLSPEAILKQLPVPETKETEDQVAKRLSICMGLSTPTKSLIKKSKRRILESDSDDDDVTDICEGVQQVELEMPRLNKNEYEILIREAQHEEVNGNEIKALDLYMTAFNLSGHDESLELKIFKLGKKLNML